MEDIDCVVIGAGVVGLAVARALAMAGREVILLESADAFGTETSSRNSEVIHAGIYYPAGSLKARLCVQGRRQLYAYCAERGIAHRRCGKLIVANGPEQVAQLAGIERHARANGVEELQVLDGAQARALEPALRCDAALLSPVTGIIDSHGLMLALLGEAQDHGAMLALKSPLLGATVSAQGIELRVGGDEPMALRARTVVNSAGLHAPAVAARIEGLDPRHVPVAGLCKGNYFSLIGRAPFSRLIYPVPERAGLGVHLTLDLAGQGRFGPDVQWIDAIDYSVDPARCANFTEAIRSYWPGLPDDSLAPGYSGIRPKLGGPADAAADFVIQAPAEHGVPGLVNLFGIESPGLTSSLAIADEVVARLAEAA
ncbi:MAG: NAD(P)/FAD-dependent oxidoreductase [Betaproteobacteria bacterium]|nr:NAD(P)/FAD-dependent oxidoreductase [Betaproteobacteria bacterium]